MRRPFAMWLVLLLVVLPTLAACSKPARAPQAPAPRTGLRWTGSELQGPGLKYYQRKAARATVHYALPTSPDTAEKVADRAVTFYNAMLKQERAPRAARLDIWVVPPGYAWPENTGMQNRFAQAVGAGTLIVMDPGNANLGRLDPTLYVAAFEGPQSPLYTVEWLHDAQGLLLLSEWAQIPGLGWSVVDLQDSGAPWALANLLIDRFGANWTDHYPVDPATFTKEYALKWATGASTVDEAVQRWTDRVEYLRQTRNSVDRLTLSTAADVSPLRMQPTLGTLPPGPGAGPNASPHAYDLTLRFDPAAGLVTGQEKLTWRNGEGIPVAALYFNLWANAEGLARYGAGTEIQAVKVGGAPATFEAKALDLKVDLGRALAPGEQAEVSIQFATRLSGGLTRLLGHEGTDRFYLARFFPILAVLDDRGWNLTALHSKFGDPYSEPADYRVTLDVPAKTAVGATGHLLSRVEKDGRWVYQYEARSVPEWGAVGGSRLQETRGEAGGVSIRVLGTEEIWRNRVLAGTQEAVTYLQQVLGPLPTRDLVVTQGSILKLPGVIGVDDLDSMGYFKNVLANGVAHQWFGNHVGSDQWGEAWLDEGLSMYMERRAARAQDRERTAPAISILDLPRDGNVSRGGVQFLLKGNYGYAARGFSCLFFEDLEKRIGTPAMDRLLGQWIATYGGKTATGADFLHLAEQVAGGSLAEFAAEHLIDVRDRVPYQPLLPLGVMAP